jgi:hypothetical protein
MEQTISSDGMVKVECNGIVAYYHSKYIFGKLKYRIENDEKRIKIGRPLKIKLEVVDLGVVE